MQSFSRHLYTNGTTYLFQILKEVLICVTSQKEKEISSTTTANWRQLIFAKCRLQKFEVNFYVFTLYAEYLFFLVLISSFRFLSRLLIPESESFYCRLKFYFRFNIPLVTWLERTSAYQFVILQTPTLLYPLLFHNFLAAPFGLYESSLQGKLVKKDTE